MKAKTWLLITLALALHYVSSQLVNGIDWSTCPSSSRPTPLARTASTTIAPTFISEIRSIFPEGKTPNSLLVNPDNDAFIILESASNVTFTFILEGADYRNQFGYFIFDPSTRTVNPTPGYVPIFPDVSTSSRMGANGCLFSGVTVTVGPFPASTIIGFWVRADGYSNPNNADTWASYTTDVLTNVDGCRHIAWTKINGQVVIGFEDLRGLGDMDYNDVMFYFTTDGNFTASPGLVEVVNGTLQGCVRSDLRISTAYQCTQFAVLDAASSLACQGFIKVPDSWVLAPNDATTRSAVLSNPSLFTNPDGSSICMVLADGTSVDNKWTPCSLNTAPQVFSKDGTCYYVGCERRLLIKGTTSTSSCTGQRDLLCNPSVASSILSSFPDSYSSGMSVFPQSWTVYMSDLLAGSATVNFTLNTLPQAAQRFDVMVLLDTNNMLSTDFDTAKNQIPVLYSLLNNKFARPPNVGFAIHSQLSSSTYRLDVLSRLTSDVNQLTTAVRNIPSLSSVTRIGNSQLIQSVQALANENSIGWRGGNVLGAIVVVTVSSQQRNSTLTASLRNSVYGSGITPIYIVPSTGTNYNPYADYNTFTTTTLKVGWSLQSNTYQWSASALLGLDSYSNSIAFYPAPGVSSPFWDVVPSSTTVAEACTSSICPFTGFTVRYPADRPVGSFTFPLVASLNIPGIGVAKINILSDAAPILVDPFFVLNEDSRRQFSLKDFASDEDGNSLRVVFLELPSGPIIAEDSYATLVNSYDISTPFTYVPPHNFYGQETALFRVTDGCKNSTIGTITFAVNPINDPPAAQSTSYTIDQDTLLDIDLSDLIADVEDSSSALIVVLKTLPENSALFQLISSQLVEVTETEVPIATIIRLMPMNSWFGNTSFTYYVQDSAGDVSTVGSISVQVNPINHRPICFNVLLTGNENSTMTLSRIGGTDVDGSLVSVTLLSVSTIGGDLLMDEQLVDVPVTVASGSLVTFSPASDVNGVVATISYVVSDGAFASDPCTATIFLVASNTTDSFTTANSAEFLLSEGSDISIGFDDYVSSDGATTVVIASLPLNGKLLYDGGVAAVGTSLTGNKTFAYVPNQYYNGNDTFEWFVLDGVNARADATFDFIVTPVNTAPLSSNIIITTFRSAPAQINNFVVDDPDSKLSSISLTLLDGTGLGQLSDPSKSSVAFPQTYSYGEWSFLWTPPADLPFFTGTTTVATYSFMLNDGFDNSPVYTITVNLLYSNYPPTGADSVTTTPQDTSVLVVLEASDYESASENLRTVIVSLSGNGNFYIDSSLSQLVVAGSQLPNKQMWFMPAPGAYSTETPLATFSYFIVDEGSQLSPVYNGFVYVNQTADRPQYGGALTFDVFEDSQLSIMFDDQILYPNGTRATTVMTITEGVYKGQLFECADSAETCQKIILTADSVVINPEKQLFFMPNPNENGLAYSAFVFILTSEEGVGRPYVVTINVIPINDVPAIHPNFPTMPDRVVFDEDTEYIFSWTASDVDSPLVNISTKITSTLPDNAQIFVCTSYIDDICVKGEELTPPTYVPCISEGVWAVAFVPSPNAYDARNFGLFNLVAEDDTGLRSPVIRSLIQVLPINDPPTIFAQYTTRTANIGANGVPTIGLHDVVIDDIDSGKSNLLMNITSGAGSNITIDYDGAFEDKTIYGRLIPAPCSRITDEEGRNGISCLDSKDHLNELYLKATRIELQTDSQSYQIHITVNDLGATDKEDRPMESSLILFASLESSLVLATMNTTTDETLTVTLSVSGGVSVLVLILGIVVFSCKGNGDIDGYFEGITAKNPEDGQPSEVPTLEPSIDKSGHGNRAGFPVFGVLAAAAAKKEKILYVPAVPSDATQPDYLATIDVDPMSPSYCKVVHRLRAPTAGDDLRRINWNVNTLKNRKYLIAPGTKSGNIHVIDTTNPRTPTLHKTILGEEIASSTGLAWPHVTRCLPSGEILVSHMADKNGNAFGGYVSMSADFELQGHWGKNSTQMGYSFAYQAQNNMMVSTGWGEPNAPKQSVGAAPDRYGRSVWLWDMTKKEVLKSVDLGDDGMMPLEVRFMHHPESAHGFVCAALNGCVWHVFKDDNDEWQFERVIKIESIPVDDWILPIMPALTTDLVISPDDKFLYISNWLHGDIRQYNITNPSNPKLVGQLYLGGSLRQDGGVKMTSGQQGIEVPEVKGRKLQGAPQFMQLSLDGKRLYITNSFISSWDVQFYPELEAKGSKLIQVEVNVKEGGLALNKEFLIDFADEPDGPAVAREMRLSEGDCTSDICK